MHLCAREWGGKKQTQEKATKNSGLLNGIFQLPGWNA